MLRAVDAVEIPDPLRYRAHLRDEAILGSPRSGWTMRRAGHRVGVVRPPMQVRVTLAVRARESADRESELPVPPARGEREWPSVTAGHNSAPER